MYDFEIARYLYRVAFLYEKFHDSLYKARAYYKAALAVDGYSAYIEGLYHDGNLRSLPSIGASIEKNIVEIIETMRLSLIDDLLGDIPESVFDLYEYSNIKNKVMDILIEHEVYDFAGIERIIESNAAFLSPSDIKILSAALDSYESRRFQYAHVYELANELIRFLQNNHLVHAASMSDDLYFHREAIETGIIICSLTSDYKELSARLKSCSSFRFVSLDDNCVNLERFGVPFKLLILSEDKFNETLKELEAQKKKHELSLSKTANNLPFLGDLHMHTVWSDGLHSIEQMRDMAVELGYEYIAVTDHSQSLKPSGMSELDTLTQIRKIREMNKGSAIPILAGIEVEILANGFLDLPDSILKEFDIVIAAVHSHFNQPPHILIERISKALSNKYVNILAHPTGRLLGRPGKPTVCREEMQIHFDYLLNLCRENDVALELNCFPERFDLSIANIKKAVTEGVRISIGTDAHSIYHLTNAKYVLEALKYANIPAEAILNCQTLSSLKEILNAKRCIDEKDITTIFEEKFKNFNYYFSNNNGILSGTLKAVGIDLTGSETKASGFAVLSGAAVDTVLVFKDNEMIERILKIKPAVVSIDSPLSLPEGRCCGNKSCKCAKHGIMRYCELTLKRFGIGVYPCLIDSMVNLTMRGIELAVRLRALGFHVIESYPGVAQDLLHIPRKRRGLELLINGMKNFGIKDIREDVTHDEADAITSALVGYFYLDDKYIGMGNEKEDYLIVPKLDASTSGKGIVIGLTGYIAAGKTTAAEYLRFKYGFTSMRFSKLIEEKYNVSGREDLQRIGLEIASNPIKQKELSDLMISKINERENYVIDGIRQLVDYENLSLALGNRFTLLFINAPFAVRADRYRKLNPDISKEHFQKIDTHPVEEVIDALSKKSAYKADNSKSYKELMVKLGSLMHKLSNKGRG